MTDFMGLEKNCNDCTRGLKRSKILKNNAVHSLNLSAKNLPTDYQNLNNIFKFLENYPTN